MIQSHELPQDMVEVNGVRKYRINVEEVVTEESTYYTYEEVEFSSSIPVELTDAKMVKLNEKLNYEKTKAQRKQAMLDGANYNGYQVSFTAEDGNGMIQVKSGFELGLTSTTIHFENGTEMPITAEEFQAFALWFVNERNKFFV